ncbi:hypothetical protein RZS08_56665, partial [Arthrospira platensis SPKY1]|nr:hypothetical protein [Arthrospira platensis SPKY1]
LNAETIAEVEALAAELRDMMANLRPDGTPVRPIPDKIADQRAALIELRTDLAKSRAAVIAELGPDATAEDICMALAEWHVVNESTIAAMRELSQDLAEWMRSNRPVRPERPEVSAEIQE